MSTTEQTASHHAKTLVLAEGVDVDYSQHMLVQLTVTGTVTGSTVFINVAGVRDPSKPDHPVVYSLGNESSTSAGLQISLATAGSLPLSSYNLTPNQMTLQTASSGGGGNQWTVLVQGYLAAPVGTTYLQMSVNADPSVMVQVAFNNGLKNTLGNSPSQFPWRPIST